MFEKVRAEWPVIRDAPWSVGSLVVAALVTGFVASTFLANREINSLKAERDLFKSQIESGRPAGPSAQSAAKLKPLARGKSGSAPEPPNSADYVPRSVAERFLALKHENATPLQINHLLQPYVGKHIRLAADLLNAEMQGGHVWVQLDPGGAGRGSLFVSFNPRWAEQLSVIPRGQRIEFDVMIGEGNPPELVDGGLS
jgi:hypothetical protein